MTTRDIFMIKQVLSVNETKDKRSNMLRHMILKAEEGAHYFVWVVKLLEICLVPEKIIGNPYE
jgi:hypothetical protein